MSSKLAIGILGLGVQILGFGQSVSLTIGSGAGTAGGTVSLPITLTSSGGAQASGLQWSFAYSSDITSVTVVAGPSAANAGKSATCSASGCLILGFNNTAMADGTVATATFQIASNPSTANIPVQIIGVVASTAGGGSIPAGGGSGTITVPTAPPPPDTVAPAISLTSPTSGSTFTAPGSSISLSGTASDNVGVTQVSWATDHGTSGTATGTTNWQINGLVIPAGSTNIIITAHDAAGNLANTSLAVSYTPADATAPSISILSPTSGSTFTSSGSTIDLTGTSADNVGVTQVIWSTNRGASGTASGTTSWSINGLALTPGSTTITVTARDAAGNASSANLAVSYTPADMSAPTISITAPTSGPTFNSADNSITVSGSAADNVGVTSVTWVTDRGTSGFAAGTTGWTINGLVLLPGSTLLTVTARDEAGNIGSAVLSISTTNSDTTAPTLSITTPTASSTYTTSLKTIDLAGTAADNVGVTQVTWLSDRGGIGIAAGTTSWTLDGIALQAGLNRITVVARDAAGNQTTVVLAVTCTASDPVSVSIVSPTTDSVFSSPENTVTLGGTASNATQITWASDTGIQGQAVGTSNWKASGIMLRVGSNRITVTARDAQGNQRSASITIVFKAPAIISTSFPSAQTGKFYSYKLSAAGGTPPYTWSVSPLPSGFAVGDDGLVAGTPAAAGTFSVNVSIRDSVQMETTTTLNLQVDNWLALVSAASLKQGPVSPESMVAAFGWQLADSTESATASPLPAKLAETTVTVRDANGAERTAALYYVSPSQINFTIPTDTAPGPAAVTVSRGGQSRAIGSLDIVAVAPELFFLNQDQLAAAGIVRVRGDVTKYESIAQLDGLTGQLIGIPIDLGPDTDQVYLTLYGTGFRNRSNLDSVHVYVGDVLAPVAYAGPSGIFDGLDLINVLLPRELRGKGTANIFLMVNGAAANNVRVTIQ